jgi:phosphoribulokinase
MRAKCIKSVCEEIVAGHIYEVEEVRYPYVLLKTKEEVISHVLVDLRDKRLEVEWET